MGGDRVELGINDAIQMAEVQMRGEYKVISYPAELEGLPLTEIEKHPETIVSKGENTVVANIKDDLINRLIGGGLPTVATPVISRVAFGTGTAATTQGMTQLVTEIIRKAPIDQFRTPTGTAKVMAHLTSLEGNNPANAADTSWFINEVGILNSGANSSTGTGALVARYLPTPVLKNNSRSVAFQWELTVI